MMVTSGRFGIGIKLTYHSEDTKDLPYEDFLFRSLGIPMNFMHIKLNQNPEKGFFKKIQN